MKFIRLIAMFANGAVTHEVFKVSQESKIKSYCEAQQRGGAIVSASMGDESTGETSGFATVADVEKLDKTVGDLLLSLEEVKETNAMLLASITALRVSLGEPVKTVEL